MAQEYAGKTITALQQESTYPLFDSEISNTIDRLVRDELILPTPSAVEHSKHGGLANHLFDRLPTFDTATMDQIIDIRRELEGSLGKFRESVATYSREIQVAQWSPEFTKEAERIFGERVGPSVEELAERVRSNNDLRGYLKDTAAAAAGSGAIAGTLQAFIADPASIGPITTIAWAGGAAAWAEHKRRQKNKDLKQNRVYFYYRAKQQLQANQ